MHHQPIFVLGIAQRSGTNFLAALLSEHPACVASPRPMAEDHLLVAAPELERYVDHVVDRWQPRWGDSSEVRASLLGHLGGALSSFVASLDESARVVTRTPSLANLGMVTTLLPTVPVVVIVRDGRSVTESLVRGFRYSYDRAILDWRSGARELERYRATTGEPNRDVRVVRYEELVADLEGVLEPVLRFCGLDPAAYDFAAARRLPVMGSSFEGAEKGKVKWDPLPQTTSFDPIERFSTWGRGLHERFNWLAGREQQALGYDVMRFESSQLAWRASNLALDVARPIRVAEPRRWLLTARQWVRTRLYRET